MHIPPIGFSSSRPAFPRSLPTPPEIISQMNRLQPRLCLRLRDPGEPRQMDGTGGGCEEQPNSLCFEDRVTIFGYGEDEGSAFHGYRVSVREDVKVPRDG